MNVPIKFLSLVFCYSICSLFIPIYTFSDIVINEIHFDPDDPTELVEFIELTNTGTSTVDLSGWSVSGAVEYSIPNGITINAGGYLVVCQSPNEVSSKYRVSSSKVMGPFEGRLDNNGETIELFNAEGECVDEVDYQLGFPWPTVGDPVSDRNPGTSFSIQLLNPSLDNDLGGSWRSFPPSPGTENDVLTDNIPPQIRQVNHSPKQPESNESVLITAKVTDPDGVDVVQLHYQIVDPGNYITIHDSAYETEWVDIQMHDDGLEGDQIAGDFVYSIQMPSSLQQNRRLIRYRITVSDQQNNTVMVPYVDDPQPNFAYFTYDGVPPWTGAVRPGYTEEVTYSSELLSSIPVYHLITSKEEAENCTWRDQYPLNDYPYTGTLIYDGKVYDHIRMRARGGVWRYSMGKNMWKFNMNRGHAFQAKDNYGRNYKTKWDKLNLGANIQQRDYWHRGEQGMFESVGFKLFDLAGIESPETHFVHFRIIDEEHEDGQFNASHPPLTNSGTQYDGDFWGLYLATEQVDGHFLERNGLPDGNLYKMEGGFGEIRNQSPYGVKDSSDLSGFLDGFRRNASEQWWRQNSDLPRYYNYRSIVEAIHHYDIASGKNYYFYLNPITNQWFHLPWDIDLTWADNMYGQGDDPFKQSGILRIEPINIEYQNRQREVLDLLYNPDQAGQLINEYASIIYNPNGESFVDADRAMWDYHWVMSDQAAQRGYKSYSSKSGQGEFYQVADTKDFPGMVTIMKDYVIERNNWIFSRILDNDEDIPGTPQVTSLSENYQMDSLKFEVSDFSSPDESHSFAALKWRIAEVEPFAVPHVPDYGSVTNDEQTIHFLPESQWSYFKGTEEPSTPNSTWRLPGFDDSVWSKGSSPIGYGESIVNTNLSDMRGNYTSFYMRKTFEIDNPDSIGQLSAFTVYDDGYIMWINGNIVDSKNVRNEELPYNATANSAIEELDFTQTELPYPNTYLLPGTNTVTVQVLNSSVSTSSDAFFDMALVSQEIEDHNDSGPIDDPDQPQPFQRYQKPPAYEIDAVWESEEITAFQNQITIPSENLTAGKTYRVRAKMKDSTGRWSHWSTPIQFEAQSSPSQLTGSENLRITELMYNPSEELEFEFIELHNTHINETLQIDGFAFTDGITYTFPAGTTIPPMGYLILSNALDDSERSRFRQNYELDDQTQIYGPYEGSFDNGGEQVVLESSSGDRLISFDYNDGRGWVLHADGLGHSLIPQQTAMQDEGNGSLDYGGNWRASAYIGGSPGAEDPEPEASLLLNELSAVNALNNDWIELYNPTETGIALGSWFLSDDKNELRKWALPNFQIQPGQYVSFDADTGFNAGDNGFSLNSNGEEVLLSYLPGRNNRVVDSVSFKAQDETASWGRNPTSTAFWTTVSFTRDSANTFDEESVVIDEMMYRPGNDNPVGEYIELHNPTELYISLSSPLGPWRIDGGVEFVFPSNLTMPPQSRLVIVSFDPQNQLDLNTFTGLYDMDASQVQILGPYSGNLSNRGERIALERLMDLDETDGSMEWAIIDEVIYFDRSPWTENADGTGMSLQRINHQDAGNSPSNWNATTPQPGEEEGIDTNIPNWSLY